MIMQTEKDLLKACCDYLDILETQGHVLWWRDNISCEIPKNIVCRICGNIINILRGRSNKPGFSDLIVWKKNTWERLNNSGGVYEVVVIIHTLLIELKLEKGRLSKAQKAYQKWFEGNQSHVSYYVIRSFEDFHALFSEYGIEI